MRLATSALVALFALLCVRAQAATCNKPLYLTFDTGHMGVAPLIADVLKRHDVKATFFLADERTKTGGTSLDDEWAPWWKGMAAQGHAFGSHSRNHIVWLANRPDGGFRFKATAGPKPGQIVNLTAQGYCEELRWPAERFRAMTGQDMLPLFRAPAGKTSPALLATAKSCGYEHVGWSPAGFLGDELPSGHYPNELLLRRALTAIRAGDILVAHLGIWSRQDPWAPAVLEPLIEGLKLRGFCFETLRQHPVYGRVKQR